MSHPDSSKMVNIDRFFSEQYPICMNHPFRARQAYVEAEDWNRIRAAIEHENTLVNQRLTWLLGAQTILFAGFGVVFAVDNGERWQSDLSTIIFLTAIAWVAIIISVNIRRQIDLAGKQLAQLDSWWHRMDIASLDEEMQRKLRAKRLPLHPPLQLRDSPSFGLDEMMRIENVFIICWLLVFSLVLLDPLCRLLSVATIHFGMIQEPLNCFKLSFCIISIALVTLLIKRDFDRKNSRRR